MGEKKRLRQRSRESSSASTGHGHGHSHHHSKRAAEVKRPKLTTNVGPIEMFQQQHLTPESPDSAAGRSGMKNFLLTELRREMGLPLQRRAKHNHNHTNNNVDEKSVNLACPLFIRDPAAFTHVRNSCTDGNIKGGIGKLIEHIKRVHLRSDKQCHHCGARYGSKPAELKSSSSSTSSSPASHARNCTKIWSLYEPPLLTEDQQRVLESLSVRATGQSLDYKYRHKLLMKLFPGQEEWAKRVEIYHDSYMPCLLPAQLMFEAMERAVDSWERGCWERGYATSPQTYDSDGSDTDSDRSREYRHASDSSGAGGGGASLSTDASSAAYPSAAASGGYSRTLGDGGGGGYGSSQQPSSYHEQLLAGYHEDQAANWGECVEEMLPMTTGPQDQQQQQQQQQHYHHVQVQMTSTTRKSTRRGSNKKYTRYKTVDDAAYSTVVMQMQHQHHHHQQEQQTYQTYSHSGTVDDFDDAGSASYVDFEPVFDVVSTVPSDYHSYTIDVEQQQQHGFPSEYYLGQGHHHLYYQPQKDTMNPNDMHNTLIGLGSATVPRYLVESEEDSGIVLQDTQEYLGGRITAAAAVTGQR